MVFWMVVANLTAKELGRQNGWTPGTVIAIYMMCGFVVAILHTKFMPLTTKDSKDGK